jgi:hypothetical protein
MPELKVFVYRPFATAPNRKVVVPLHAVRRVSSTVGRSPGSPAEVEEDLRGTLLEIETETERIVIAIE